jgi:two-component system, chemotaxis family, chemotaxis protein CheY
MAKNILAVDDSASMRQILEATLSEAGYTVTIAADGREALTHALATPFDLVLTDQNMPALSGLELVRALRELETYQETPILILTTEDSADFKDAARDCGANGWLNKPFDPRKLTEIVGSLVEIEGV